jgi:hypothetical protein
MTSKKNSINNELLNEKHVKGVVSELKATEILLKHGLLVYKNVSPNGLVDLIAMDQEGRIFLIDVKTISFRKKYKQPSRKEIRRSPSGQQKKLGVILMIIDRESVRFSPARCPLSKIIKSQ